MVNSNGIQFISASLHLDSNKCLPTFTLYYWHVNVKFYSVLFGCMALGWLMSSETFFKIELNVIVYTLISSKYFWIIKNSLFPG